MVSQIQNQYDQSICTAPCPAGNCWCHAVRCQRGQTFIGALALGSDGVAARLD